MNYQKIATMLKEDKGARKVSPNKSSIQAKVGNALGGNSAKTNRTVAKSHSPVVSVPSKTRKTKDITMGRNDLVAPKLVASSASIPKLNGMFNDPRYEVQKPSTKYQNKNAQKPAETKKRDTKYDADFNEFHKYRVGEFLDRREYDATTDQDVEAWRNRKKEIMQKNNWSEAEFDKRWDEYYKDRAQKEADQYVANAASFAGEHPLAGTLLQYAETPGQWLEGGGTVLEGILAKSYLPKSLKEKYLSSESTDPHFTSTRAKAAMKQAVKDNYINGNVAQGIYDAVTSVPEMAGGALGMAAQAGANAQMQALERGVDKKDAAVTGLGSAVSSYVANKLLGIEESLGKGGAYAAKNGKELVKSIMKSAASEGMENYVEDILNIATDTIVNQDKSQVKQMHDYFKSQGMSEPDALWELIKYYGQQEATSVGSGALFGGIMGGLGEIGKPRIPELKAPEAETYNVYTPDETVMNAARQATQAQAEIERLRQQIPEVPEEAPTETQAGMEGVQENNVLQANLDDVNTKIANLKSTMASVLETDLDDAIKVDVLNKIDRALGDLNARKNEILSGMEKTGVTPAEVAGESAPNAMQNVDFKPSIHNADGQLLDTVKVPEYSADSNVFFNGSDTDVALAEAQDAAITDTFRNIVSDPEFNALSFKNGRQEVYVSPSTNGSGYRVSYTVDGVPTGHHDYTLDEIDALSQNLREMAGNGGEDISIQRKSDLASQSPIAGESAPIEANNSVGHKARYDEVTAQIADLDEQIARLEDELGKIPELKKNAKDRRPIKNEIYQLEQQRKQAQKQQKVREKLANGKKVGIRALVDAEYPELFKAVYDGRNGLVSNIDMATKFAGNTPEAKAAAQAARTSLYAYLDGGEDADLFNFLENVGELSEMADNTRAEYRTNNGYTHEYENYFVDDAEEGIHGSLANDVSDALSYINEIHKIGLENKGANAQTADVVEDIDVPETVEPEVVEPEVQQPQLPMMRPNAEPVASRDVPKVGTYRMPETEQSQLPNVRNNDVANVPPTNVGGTVDNGNGRHTKTSEAYTNTGQFGKGWTAQEYKDHTSASQFQYEDIDEMESIDRAANILQEEGLDGFKDRVMDKERLSSVEMDALMMEWRIIGQQARLLEMNGQDASDAWRESVRIFRKIQEQSTSNAQALQALAKWTRNTPEGMLAEAENIINRLLEAKKPEKSEVYKQYEKFAKKNKEFKFTDEFAIEFQQKAKELEGLDMESREAKKIMAELGKMVNRQRPSTLGEKAMTILMDNMLGNFRTLITRNAGGNIGLNAVEQLVQRPLAAGIDRVVAKKTGRRTQAGLTRDGLKEYINGFAKGLKEEAADFKEDLHTARSGENNLRNAINSNRHVFKEKGVMDRLDKLVRHGLSVGDRPFYEAVYNQTLGDYERLRERGQMGDAIQALSDDDFRLYAETAAKLNALSAVYQQDSQLSGALLKFKDAVGDLSEGIVGVDVLSQFSMPFVKTPANVIERAIDYSPLGLLRNTARTIKENRAGQFDQNRFVNESARNILGTALMGGGAALARGGAISGGYSDDNDEKQAQKESGMQEYALNLPGGYQMDIGWIPVVGSNLVAAAAGYDAFENGEGGFGSNVVRGLEAGGQALFDQSMFQGLQRLFGTGESYDSDKGIVANMGNVIKAGVGQAIPSLLRQANQVVDPYQRDVSNSNKAASFAGFSNYDLNSLANNLPVARQLGLAPKVNQQGNLVKENQGRNIGMKILEDMILPGKITKVEYSKLNEEAARLKDATGDPIAYMPKATRTQIDTEDHTLTNDEWVDYQQNYYRGMTQFGNALMKSDAYKDVDDNDKSLMLYTGYQAIRQALQSEYNGKELKGAAKAYDEAGGGAKGVKAVMDYVTSTYNKYGLDRDEYNKAVKEGEDLSRLEGYKQALEANGLENSKAFQETYKEGGEQALNEMADAKKFFKEQFDLDAPAVAPTWEKARQEFPELKPNEFDKQFREIAGMSAEGDKMAIAQDEITSYVNKHPEIYKKNGEWDMDAITKLWNGFGSSGWKQVPYVKKDGSLGHHKQ